MPQKTKTLLEILDRLPPALVRAMAVHPGHGAKNGGRKPRLVGLRELCRKSGLAKRTVAKLSKLGSWEGINVRVASDFCHACGVDITRKHNAYEFTRRYVERDFPHMDLAARKKLFKAMNWLED